MRPAIDRYLVVVLGVVAVAGLLLMRPPVPSDTAGVDRMLDVPAAVGPWHAVDGAPETTLPIDSRALQAVRRTYSDGRQTVWLSLARYSGSNDPRTRPAVFRITASRGSAFSDRGLVTVSANGRAGDSTVVNRVAVHHAQNRLSILYWYELGERVISNEYELRLRLFANTLVGHSEPLFLFRLASEDDEAAGRLLGAIRRSTHGGRD